MNCLCAAWIAPEDTSADTPCGERVVPSDGESHEARAEPLLAKGEDGMKSTRAVTVYSRTQYLNNLTSMLPLKSRAHDCLKRLVASHD